MELPQPTPLPASRLHRVSYDSDRTLGSSSTDSGSNAVSSLPALISDDFGSPYSGWSSTNPAISSPPTSPAPTSSYMPLHNSGGRQGSPYDRRIALRSGRGFKRIHGQLSAAENADLDHAAESGKSWGKRMQTKPCQRPPFCLIPTTPETADAILVIPGPTLSPSSGWLSTHGIPTPYSFVPGRSSQSSSTSSSPSAPPPSSFSCGFSSYGLDVKSEGDAPAGESGTTARKSPRTQVQALEQYRQRQQRGLLFVGAAMAHVHAVRRARRVPPGTRMRAFKVLWNRDPRVVFGKAGMVPVPLTRIT